MAETGQAILLKRTPHGRKEQVLAEPGPIDPRAPDRDAQRYRLHGVERALDTLELLAAAGPGGMTLTELAARISVSKSSAFALLQTLIARGFVADSGRRLHRS